MPASMSAAAHPTYANVLFLRVPRFAGLTVAEQAAAKHRLEARARKAFAGLPEEDRVVLDADDGLALVVFGDPGRALDVAHALGRQAEGEPLLAGLNHGPLALTSGNADARIVGDGIAAAAAAARFAPEGQLLVTQDFARALEATAPERAVELVTAGDFTDTRVRQHTFYGHDAQRGILARRRSRVRAAGIVVAILLAGVIGRDIYQPLKLLRPAVVTLDVKPRGEVFVDNVSMGKIPPLTQIEVAPGKRRIVIRSPGVAPYDVTREFRPGEKVAIAHTFPRPPAGKGGSDFWKDLKRSFGS
jgi:hypothetical protein